MSEKGEKIYKSTHDSLTYRSSVAPRQLIIQRARSAPRSKHAFSDMVIHQSLTPPSGAYATMSSGSLQTVMSSKDKEKKELQGLNDRFAKYIQNTKAFEIENKDLKEELQKLKIKWGEDTQKVKLMYESELNQLRNLVDDNEKDKSKLVIENHSLEEQVEELNETNIKLSAETENLYSRIEDLNRQLNKAEADVGPLRRRAKVLEDEKGKDKETIEKLKANLSAARSNLDESTLLHVDAENRKQTLEEEIAFLKQVHEQEIKELKALAYKDPSSESQLYWKNEIGNALEEIREVYEGKLDTIRNDLEAYYNLKLQEFTAKAAKGGLESEHAKNELMKARDMVEKLRGENGSLEQKILAIQREFNRLKIESEEKEKIFGDKNAFLISENAKLKAEMENILRELQILVDTKQGLEFEIDTYRKLLEVEEGRTAELYGKGEFIVRERIGNANQDSFKVSADKTVAEGSFLKLEEFDVDGTYVTVENFGTNAVSLGGYKIKSKIDGSAYAEYTFQKKQSILAGERIKVWAKNQKPLYAAKSDIETDFKTWGSGQTYFISLQDNKGKELATIKMNKN